MASSLSLLPPSILSLITRLLPFDSVIALGKLSGASRLWTQMTAHGGVTEVTVEGSDTDCFVVLHCAALPQFSHLTRLFLDFKLCRHQFKGLWAHHLPRTLEFISQTALDFWRRPVDEDSDTAAVMALRWPNSLVPIDIAAYFPRLRSLEFEPESSGDNWSPTQLLYLLHHLPSSLITLRIGHELPLDFATIPILTQLQELSISGLNENMTLSHIFGLTSSGQVNQNGDANLPSEGQGNPAPALQHLCLPRLLAPDVALLSRFDTIRTLSLTFSDPMVPIPEIKALPAALTRLTLEIHSEIDLQCLALAPLLSTLDLWTADDSSINYLPPTLTLLQMHNGSPWEACRIACNLPPSLTFLSGDNYSLSGDGLDKLTTLKTLHWRAEHLQRDLDPTDGQELPLHLPPSLTSLSLDWATHIAIDELAWLPNSLTYVSLAVALTEEHAELFKDFVELDVPVSAEELIRLKYLPHISLEQCNICVFARMGFEEALLKRGYLNGWKTLNDRDNTFSQLFRLFNSTSWPAHLTSIETSASLDDMLVSRLPVALEHLCLGDSNPKWLIPSVYISSDSKSPSMEALPAISLSPERAASTWFTNIDKMLKDPTQQLPQNLHSLQLSYPLIIVEDEGNNPHQGSKTKPRAFIYPLLQTAPKLSLLHLRLHPRTLQYAHFIHDLPNTITDLAIRFTLELWHWPPAVPMPIYHLKEVGRPRHDWLPLLMRLRLTNCVVPLQFFASRIPTLDYFYVETLEVPSALFPAFTPAEKCATLDDEALWRHCLTRLLPGASRHDDISFILELNRETMSKLPPSLTSLELCWSATTNFAPFMPAIADLLPRSLHTLQVNFKISSPHPKVSWIHAFPEILPLPDVAPAFPPGLTAMYFEKLSYITPGLVNLLPRGLQILVIDGVMTVDAKALFSVLPPTLRHLVMALSSIDAQNIALLPKTLETLALSTHGFLNPGDDILKAVLPPAFPSLRLFKCNTFIWQL